MGLCASKTYVRTLDYGVETVLNVKAVARDKLDVHCQSDRNAKGVKLMSDAAAFHSEEPRFDIDATSQSQNATSSEIQIPSSSATAVLMPCAPLRKDCDHADSESLQSAGSSTTNADGSLVTTDGSMADDQQVMREDIVNGLDDKQLEVLRLRNGRKTCPSSIMRSDISSADDDNDYRNASFNDLQYAAFLDVQKERWPNKRTTHLPSITQRSDVIPACKPQDRRNFRPLRRLPTKESQATKMGRLRGQGMPADRAAGYRRSGTNIADFDSARGFQLDPL